MSELGRHLDELARALDRPGDPSDWRDEHQRAELYGRAVVDPRMHDLLYAAIQHEPEPSIAGWVVCGGVEHGDPAGDARWLALEAAGSQERRIRDLLVLRAVLGGAAVGDDDVDTWPDWLQRRLAAMTDRPDVLALLAERGRSKRVRLTARDRVRARPSSDT